MKESMNITLESRRKMVADWMIELPFGENDSTIEKAIDNAILSGKERQDVIKLISVSFSKEIDEYLKWNDEIDPQCFMKEIQY